MLTKLTVRNFKRFGEVEIELGNPVVFVGPNNSGKTSAMQALALWDLGVKRWLERRGSGAPEQRPGVTVNRRDLLAVPHPHASLLWSGLRTRNIQKTVDGKQETKNIRIDVVVEGISEGKSWKCGLEFDYANQEIFYCRPLRLEDDKATPRRMPVPDEAEAVHIAFLPPMSGLAAQETRLDMGAVNVRVGEGRTAEVLRNLCYLVHGKNPKRWKVLVNRISDLFGATLEAPRYIAERGEIEMVYRERERGPVLDLSSSGRGLQQTLLILAYMYANPGAVLLLDEPDAHLEILRQRQIYNLVAEAAKEGGNQIVAASHSEVLLKEAAGRDTAVAFVGKPHRLGGGKESEVLKALEEIGFDDYYQAEQTGWALYLEGSTDLAILQAFARRLGHPAARALERPFVAYVGNQPNAARRHFHGLREALPGLRGAALFDRLDRGVSESDPSLPVSTWAKREIENYFCTPATLERYASATASNAGLPPLFAAGEADRRLAAMREAVAEVSAAMATLDKGSPWDADAKVSDDFLKPLFRAYFGKLGLPNLMAKRAFYELADLVPESEIDPEIGEKLDAIARVAEAARPAGDGLDD